MCEQKLKSDDLKGIGITLSFDGWKNVRNQAILGSVFVLPSGETLIWKGIDISGERDRMIDIMPKIESMLEELTTLNIEIGAVVSDSASGYAAAR